MKNKINIQLLDLAWDIHEDLHIDLYVILNMHLKIYFGLDVWVVENRGKIMTWHKWHGPFPQPNLSGMNASSLGEAENERGAKNGYRRGFGFPLEMLLVLFWVISSPFFFFFGITKKI